MASRRPRSSVEHMTVIKAAQVEPLGRGGGVVTIPLITRKSAGEENKITTGISIYPAGTGAPLHSHNCDEHVTLLEGAAEVEIAEQRSDRAVSEL
jgi:mannose-6-phosphate isomerase-like protein (cupin superfamily)